MMAIDMFHCSPLASTLTRSACGARYERKIGRTCATCAVGRQHARGAIPAHWPDGSPIEDAAITPATIASLRVHLAVIESYTPPPARGTRVAGATIREHAERLGLEAQVIRSRLNRGRTLDEALTPGHRGVGRHPLREVQLGRERLSLREFARRVERPLTTIHRWISRGLTAQQILERAA